MPWVERAMQMMTSMTRAMRQDVIAGRIISEVR